MPCNCRQPYDCCGGHYSVALPCFDRADRDSSPPLQPGCHPPSVFEELQDPETPSTVRYWLAASPSWLQVQPLSFEPSPDLDFLDRGEREALTLAEELCAEQVLIDESAARREAARRKLPFIGTLGILRKAAQLGWLDLPSALTQLQNTSSYVDDRLIQSLLQEDALRRT